MEAADRLEKIILQVIKKFSSFSEEEWNAKLNPAKWSKKEILGHLIDSEYNNHIRIIKSISTSEPLIVESYMQDEWVKRNLYKQQNINDVYNKWIFHQQSFANLVKNISDSELRNDCILAVKLKLLSSW